MMNRLLLVFGILMGSIGCFGQKQVCFQDSVFLEIRGKLVDPSKTDSLIRSNMGIYIQAFNRFQQTVSVKNNRLVWRIKSGAEIRISESIYDYFVEFLTYNNEVNLPSGDYEIRKDKEDGYYYPMLKTVSMEGYVRLSPKELRRSR